jgi:multiple sugar transport system permease protein
MVMVALLTLYPVTYSIWLSLFTKHSYLPVQDFVGLANYIEYLYDPQFWESFKLGLIYSVSTVVLQISLGVGASLILNEAFKGRGLIRAVVLFPYMIPTIVGVILWKWLLHETYGLVDHYLLSWGLVKQPIVWVGAERIMYSLIIISTWQFFPFVVISVLARLQTINPELYDAAKVDGASAIYRFFHITLPQIKNVLFVVLLLRTIFMFTKFDTVWLLGGSGGAGRFIRTLPIYAYMKTFGFLQAGMGATLAVIMFLLLVTFSAVYFLIYRREEEL